MSVELETKGTTSSNIKSFVKDILNKKSTETEAHFRYGTIAVLSTPEKSHGALLYVCDDPPDGFKNINQEDDTPWHYIAAFRYILDNKYYNEFIRTVIQGNKPKKNFKKIKEKFFGTYNFQNETYYGEFFDYRVNIENISAVVRENESTLDDVFDKLTKAQGRNKIFIGIHSDIVDLVLNGDGLIEIFKLQLNKVKETTDSGIEIIRDSDSIIVVIASNKNDSQIENQFFERVVKNRIGQMVKLERYEPTMCSSPCRSREKKGKPCEIMTYRGACHFHR